VGPPIAMSRNCFHPCKTWFFATMKFCSSMTRSISALVSERSVPRRASTNSRYMCVSLRAGGKSEKRTRVADTPFVNWTRAFLALAATHAYGEHPDVMKNHPSESVQEPACGKATRLKVVRRLSHAHHEYILVPNVQLYRTRYPCTRQNQSPAARRSGSHHTVCS
jgi:hypothetical protein